MNRVFKKTKKGFDIYIEYFSSSTLKTVVLLLFVNILFLWANIYLMEQKPEITSHISSLTQATPTPGKARIADLGVCGPCLANGAYAPFICTAINGNSSYCNASDITNDKVVCVDCRDVAASLTPTASPTASLTPTASPTASLTPTNTPTATPVPNGATAHVTFEVKLPGIGGNTGAGENNNPVRHARSFGIHLYNSQDQQVKQQEVTLTYNGSSYLGTATITGIPMDSYTIRIELNNSLLKVIPGVVKLKDDTTTVTPQVTLIMGNIEDANGYHNVLDILDYNALLKCFNGPCNGATKQLADLNDDDSIDVRDVNILLRGFSSRDSN